MAFTLPDWLTPPDFLGASVRGAGIGAELRSQDIKRETAADRLQAAYEQLALKEEFQSRLAEQRNALAAEKLSQNQQRIEDLARYQQGLLGVRGESVAERERHNREMADVAAKRLEDLLNYHKDIQDRFEKAEERRARNTHMIDGKPYLFENGVMKEVPIQELPEAQAAGGPSILGSLWNSLFGSDQGSVPQIGAIPDSSTANPMGISPTSALAAPPETPQPSRVRVTSPDGKTGTVPKSRLQEYLDAGYTEAQ